MIIGIRSIAKAGHGDEIVRLLLGNLRDHAILALDDRGAIQSWNAGAESLLGYREDEAVGARAAGLLAPDEAAGREFAGDLESALAMGRVERESWIARKDGSHFPASRILFGMTGEPGAHPWVLAILRDITDRHVQEQNIQAQSERLATLREVLRESDARFHAMIESVVDYAIFFVDRQGLIWSWNQGARQHTGYEDDEVRGKELAHLLSGRDEDCSVAPRLLAAAEAEGRTHWETQVKRKDGSRFPGDVVVTAVRLDSGALRGFCVILQDLTERRKAEEALRQAQEQLRQSQKMEAIGRLAGGVAHDFNNLLTAILGFSELGLGIVEDGHPVRSVLEEIARASRTAADLTRRLLAVSRKQPLDPIVLDLGEMVQQTVPMLQRVLGSDVVFTTRLAPPGAAVIRADRGMIEQVLLNLAVNAKDAMPAGGSLTIETRVTERREAAPERESQRSAGCYASLIVRDTGTGMDDEVKAHLFEPFFTTKEKGKGTGLGLSTSYGMVRQSGGEIEVESEPGRGSAFSIHLPRVEDAPEPGPAAGETGSKIRASGETILVVDDEEMVRNLVRSILEKAGYRVLPAGSGAEALELWRREAGGIPLLLTDVVMPGMNGLELAERLRSENPRLTVVIMSGYPADVDMSEALTRERYRFLHKPFAPEKLLRTLKSARQAGR